MLHKASRVRGASILARDGEIGTVDDFYFEESAWTVRYVLVDTGRWMNDRRVLISPMSVANRWDMATVPVTLTKEQVRNSPEIDFRHSLSRESEAEVLSYYGYPHYWGASGVWGPFDDPGALLAVPPPVPLPTSAESQRLDLATRNLRSTTEVTGYHLHATDGEIGHVDDVLIGQESWRIRYLLLDTSNWIGGRSVVISPSAIRQLNHDKRLVHVELTRDQIKRSEPFESIETAVGPGETGPPFIVF